MHHRYIVIIYAFNEVIYVSFTEKREVVGSAQDLSACVSACCSRAKCGVAVLQGEVCLALECHSIDACHLRPASGSLAVVVQPAGDAEWVLPPR
ncbi:hypothetical protein E2C01_075696 [Portunus trituberculatus]|uniref:MANSC domain-containing protein n=1 Tax=Portunus trituberculatus TaxID=210409 RepID=A0A5B7IFQ3_PORTR|nr:hypothetical protein [Portunus trituberculatus]